MSEIRGVLTAAVLVALTGIAQAQEQEQKPAGVTAVLSSGVAFLVDDYQDFTKNNGALLVSNDSKYRASGLAGALFRLRDVRVPFSAEPKQLSVHTSVQFTQGTAALLDGFFLGGALQLSDHLHLTAGVGLSKGKELSPGFRSAAAEIIKARMAVNDPAYMRFAGYDPDQKRQSQLDGLSLNVPGKETPFFPGDPIVDSYNFSYFVGVSIPVKLTELFAAGGNGSGKSGRTEPDPKSDEKP